MKTKYLFLISLLLIVATLLSCSKSESSNDLLELSQSAFKDVSANGDILRIQIKSNGTWRVNSSAQWCIPYNEQGASGDELVISVAANSEAVQRSTSIMVTCGTDSRNIQIEQAPSTQTLEEMHYTLPVIFHVLSPANKTAPTIPAQRFSIIIDHVNQLYRGNAESSDMNLSFELATIGTNGKELATPGVEYITWSGRYPIDCEEFMTDQTGKYVNYLWDPNLYINVMVYDFEQPNPYSTILGISHLPFSTAGSNYLEGLSQTSYSYLKKSNLKFPYCTSINSEFIDDKSPTSSIYVTLAHELGHYLGLYHAFNEDEEGNMADYCTDSDYCEDTPPYNKVQYDEWLYQNQEVSSDFGFFARRINCATGEEFTARNIMDYAYCYSDQFTPDQRARVRHVLMYSPLIPGAKQTASTSIRSAGEEKIDLPIRTVQ